MTARLDSEGWFRCAKCGHKLGRVVGDLGPVRMMPMIEIKCHSCKEIDYLPVGRREDSGHEAMA